jgi:PmbA protein
MIPKLNILISSKSVMEKKSYFSNLESMQEVVAHALDYAKKLGATDAAAEISEDRGINVNVRNREAEVIEHTHDRSFGITVYCGKRVGNASSGDLKKEAVEQTVRAAFDIARFTSEDSCAGLPEEQDLCREPRELDLFHPWEISVEDAIALCGAAEDAALSADSRIVNSEGANFTANNGSFILANTAGFTGGYPYSSYSLYTSVIARDEAGMQRDGWYSMDVSREGLMDPAALGRLAGERAARRLSPQELSSRRCPVVFEAPMAKSLLRSFARAASGSALYRKSSFLLNSLGREVFAPEFSVYEDPFEPKSYGSSPFDDEGVQGSQRFVVEGGILKGHFLNSYTARKLGEKNTGNAGGPYNLYLKAAPHRTYATLAALLREMGTGLLVTELSGQGVNLTNGDYSRGASGFWVENGVIAYPVDGITIAGNLRSMLRGLTAAASDVDRNGSVRTGSVLIDEMTVAGSGSAQ